MPRFCPDAEGVVHNVPVTDSRLRLTFSVDHGDESDRLLLNGVLIYPQTPSMTSFFEPVTAPEMIESPNHPGTWFDVANPKIGYALSMHRPASTNEEMDLVELEFQLMEVDETFVHGIDKIEIKLLETASGKLLLGPSQIVPQHEGEEECTSLLCKWKSIIAHKFQKAKGCGRKSGKHHWGATGHRRPHHGKHGKHGEHGQHGEHASHKFHDHHKQKGFHAHHHHRHHKHHGGVVRFVVGIALHVLVPIALGMAVGITASLLGVLVGNFAIFVWRALFRRNSPRVYSRVPQEDVKEPEKSESFVEVERQEMEAPPVYQEVAEPKA